MPKEVYDPEVYWSKVANEISTRDSGGLIAGYDEPYYEYKRETFLKMFHRICNFRGKKVLEIGSGPGGNLAEVLASGATQAYGADISANMIEIAKSNLSNHKNVEFVKINGKRLPFENQSVDITFTATVLQHNSDDKMMREILSEACRVSKNELLICEKLDSKISGDDLCVARPVEYYAEICKEAGFALVKIEHINIRVSYYVCGAFRKLLNPSSRKEGEPITKLCRFMQNITLPITKQLDKVFKSNKDLGCMLFKRV